MRFAILIKTIFAENYAPREAEVNKINTHCTFADSLECIEHLNYHFNIKGADLKTGRSFES